MFSRRQSVGREQRQRRTLRLETIEDGLTPALVVGVSVDGPSSDQFPPVGNSGAVGPNHFVRFTIGHFTVFSRAGTQLQQKPDATFWQDAGILSSVTADALAEPRITYDPLSDRWFAVEITLKSTSNQILLARSDSNDPTGTWTAVNYTASNQFGNFPTLGVDAKGVYIGTGNFPAARRSAPTGSTMTRDSESRLAPPHPILTNKKTVTQLRASGVPMGWSPQIDHELDSSDTAFRFRDALHHFRPRQLLGNQLGDVATNVQLDHKPKYSA